MCAFPFMRRRLHRQLREKVSRLLSADQMEAPKASRSCARNQPAWSPPVTINRQQRPDSRGEQLLLSVRNPLAILRLRLYRCLPGEFPRRSIEAMTVGIAAARGRTISRLSNGAVPKGSSPHSVAERICPRLLSTDALRCDDPAPSIDQDATATLEGFGLTDRPAAVGRARRPRSLLRQTQGALEHVMPFAYQSRHY